MGGGTLRKVCEDLRDSGVTDIFLPFKVDDQTNASQCGAYGQLLYPSREFNKRVSQFVNDAKAAGFDPNDNIMSVCKQIYGDKPLRFHAWFPVFQDPYAAQIQGVTGKLKFVFNPLNPLDRLQLPNDVSYTSHLFAEPGNRRVRTQELALLKEIIRKYPSLAGINLDYIRYPEQEIVVDVSKPGESPQCIRDPRVNEIKDKDCKDIEGKYIVKRVIWNVDSKAVEEFVKMVKKAFPNKTISGDVFSSVGAMYGVGQIGLTQQDIITLGLGQIGIGMPAQLDVIMPMTYSYFGLGDWKDVKKYTAELKTNYPKANVVPDLRGWQRGITDPRSQGLLKDLQLDIQAAKDGKADGYVIFTYESLLSQSNSGSLVSIKNNVGF